RANATDKTDYGPLFTWVVDILPFIDNQELYNSWDRTRLYWNLNPNNGNNPSNFTLSQTDIGILRCPEDLTVAQGQGNLSYVVNGGFARWFYFPTWGWTGDPITGGANNATGTDWSGSANQPIDMIIAKKTAVMFLGTYTGNMPWDFKMNSSGIVDGSSTTVLATENVMAGFSQWDATLLGTAPAGNVGMNWSAPHPNWMMFVGSDNICGVNGNCTTTGLAPFTDPNSNKQVDGPGWQFANLKSTNEYLNVGLNVNNEGHSPYPNSYHSGGMNVLFCDGTVRFIADTIDGTVWAKVLTPQGSKLPPAYKQLPVNMDAIE
ncbi:MAG TPA: DUF1559 domain-containing protein, partial [Isosphaeraceae bacterium]|nr:DUF1559 domain-containing protein [Isosphaeraceae bacterium]